jgi:hypothetical protein
MAPHKKHQLRRCDNCWKGITNYNQTGLCSICVCIISEIKRRKTTEGIYSKINEFNQRRKNG